MTSGNIWKQLLLFSIPLILGNLFQQLYNIVDSIIVGNVVGSNALAAVGAGSAIIQLMIGFLTGASAGAGVVTSQYYGAQQRDNVRKAVHTTLAIAIVAGAVLSVLGVLITPWILRMIDTPEEVFADAAAYLQVFFAGHFFAVIYNLMAGILNAVGNSKRSLLYLVIAAACNIVLDVIFVAFWDMGVVGAALATDISQGISCVFILHYMCKSSDAYKIKFRDIRFYDRLLSKILKMGLPTGIQNVVISFSNVLLQAAINTFGPAVMAAYSAYNKIDGFIWLPIMSMGMAATTFVGQNYGAQQFDRIHKGQKVVLAMGVIYSVVAAALMLIVGPYCARIFTGDKDVIESCVYMMKYLYPFYWALAVQFIGCGCIRGAGKTMEAMFISVASLCVARMIWILSVQAITHSLLLVIMSYTVTWVLGTVIVLIYMKKVDWIGEGKELVNHG